MEIATKLIYTLAIIFGTIIFFGLLGAIIMGITLFMMQFTDSPAIISLVFVISIISISMASILIILRIYAPIPTIDEIHLLPIQRNSTNYQSVVMEV